MTLHDLARPAVLPADLPMDGADLFVAQLVAAGVENLFINSGTDTFPVQEAIAKRLALGLPSPRVVLCLDEMVAGAAAHGHFMISRRPQAILVHVDVGTQQIGGALHNAQRSRIGMLICAGRAPYTVDGGGEFRKGKKSHIHWIQEQLDQHGIVRNYTKWDYELRSSRVAGDVVQRALQVAASEPAGPVYLVLPLESLLDPAPSQITPAGAVRADCGSRAPSRADRARRGSACRCQSAADRGQHGGQRPGDGSGARRPRRSPRSARRHRRTTDVLPDHSPTLGG
ncbi:MAG: hypothetical protein KatS3mg060_0088 [Dehalococcoidia bacterium]|nr:MAG: hypothetical protein KatS3mg060_0088 [Dehalococcoidia bacterium]